MQVNTTCGPVFNVWVTPTNTAVCTGSICWKFQSSAPQSIPSFDHSGCAKYQGRGFQHIHLKKHTNYVCDAAPPTMPTWAAPPPPIMPVVKTPLLITQVCSRYLDNDFIHRTAERRNTSYSLGSSLVFFFFTLEVQFVCMGFNVNPVI